MSLISIKNNTSTTTKIKIGNEYIGKIENLNHDGWGITSLNGKKIFIIGALPKEEVQFKIIKNYKSYSLARTTRVIQAAKNRIHNRCEHFMHCGGCDLLHINQQYQLQIKQDLLQEQLSHFGNVTPEKWLEPITNWPWHYRHRTRLSVKFDKKKDRVLVGFREKSNSFVVDMQNCHTLTLEISALILPLRKLIASLTILDAIPQIEIIHTDNCLAIIIRHLRELDNSDIEKIIAFGHIHHLQIYLQAKQAQNLQTIFPVEHKELSYEFEELNIKLNFKPHHFTQINTKVNYKMVKQALKMLAIKPTDQVLDLFCGIGNFSLALAKFAHKVIGIELSPEMIQQAQFNAKQNHLENCKFIAADLNISTQKNIVCYLTKKMLESFDIALIDPPRSGALDIIQLLGKSCVKKILYVSCNPATLARDAGILVNSYGYIMKEIGLIDMFSQTSHIETINLFVKN